MEKRQPQTLLEAVRYFAKPQVAHDFFVSMRFPNGVACPRGGCGSADVARIKNRNAWRCRECNRQFTAKVGTCFEDSPIGFDKWLPAMWLLANTKNGTSSCELARALGVTQKTAWFMLHRVRLAMQSTTFKMSGAVEVDELYVGGKLRKSTPTAAVGRKHHGPRYRKTAVLGILERKGRIRAFVIPDVTRGTLHGAIQAHVEPGSTIYTDAWHCYRGLVSYTHYVVIHDVEYVRRHIHTNSIENFWSLLRRALSGTYIAARPFHLTRYVDEQAFRYNTRDLKDYGRFEMVAKRADGCRITYA